MNFSSCRPQTIRARAGLGLLPIVPRGTLRTMRRASSEAAMNDQTSPPAAATPAVRDRPSAPKLVKWGIVALVLAVAIGFGVHLWRQSQLYVSTDNAYVNANR